MNIIHTSNSAHSKIVFIFFSFPFFYFSLGSRTHSTSAGIICTNAIEENKFSVKEFRIFVYENWTASTVNGQWAYEQHMCAFTLYKRTATHTANCCLAQWAESVLPKSHRRFGLAHVSRIYANQRSSIRAAAPRRIDRVREYVLYTWRAPSPHTLSAGVARPWLVTPIPTQRTQFICVCLVSKTQNVCRMQLFFSFFLAR